MNSRRSSSFIAQLLLLTFSWFMQIGNSRDVNGSGLVQLNDCTCLGYTQAFECTVFDGGFTIWNSSFLDCTSREIRLRHSQYKVDNPPNVDCNHRTVMARSIEVLDNHYVSQFIVNIREEMINRTITCAHEDFTGRISIVGQQSLMTTRTTYPPPSNVHVESNDFSQITFAWDEVIAQCSPLQYVITAINCGVCPNTTADKNVTCDIQSDISLRANDTCLFAVQTQICGHLLGEKSENVTVHIDGIKDKRDSEATTLMPQAGSELVNNASRAIIVPVVASIMSTGVFLLLLIVVVLIVYMSKQIAKHNTKSGVNATPQDDAFVNHGTAAQNNQEGIYSLLQPPEENDMLQLNSADQEEVVVYADIGPSPGEGLCCETTLCFQDDKVEYAEVKSLNHEPAINPSVPSQSTDCSVPLDLNNLLHQIGTEIASKWYQLGIAVGISEEMLDECSNHSSEEAIIEVLDYWIRNQKPSWEDVAEVMYEVGLHELANSLHQGKLPRQIEEDDRIEDLHTASTSSAYDDSF